MGIRALICASMLLTGCAEPPRPVDLIITNAAVHTMNETAPIAEAVAIDDGVIVAVGSSDEIGARYRGEVLDVGGRMVLPGFHDAHVHPIHAGLQMLQCDLSGLPSVAAILAKVAACDAADPGDHWLVGGGWNLALFPDANPDKALLDDIADHRPILLRGEDGHSSWVNSRALAAAGIDAATPDPPGGIIERDESGAPSGTLREQAQSLVGAVVPEPSDAMWKEAAVNALHTMNSYGITSMIAAAVGERELALFETLAANGRLTARVVASVATAGGIVSSPATDLIEPGDRGSGDLVRVDAAKIFVDGVLEGETAALLEPYNGARHHRGTLALAPEELAARVTALDARGIQVHMHAIGDRAVRVALDAVAAARRANGETDNRHHIAHLQLVDPDDYPRFAGLGVLANFQALWAYPDAYITDVNLPQVGAARVRRMYPIRSIHDAGALIVGGSDWNVSSVNPLLAIETAMLRRDPLGEVDGVLNADERVSLTTMLRAYTVNGAYLMHQEDTVGTIEAGKRADLVVLACDLYDIAPEDISDVAVTRTFFDGRAVYTAERQLGLRDVCKLTAAR